MNMDYLNFMLTCVDSSYVASCANDGQGLDAESSNEEADDDDAGQGMRHIAQIIKSRKILDIWHNVS